MTIFWYSSGVSPWAATCSGVTAGSSRSWERASAMGFRFARARGDDRRENLGAVISAKQFVAGILGVRHQAEDVSFFVAHPGDVIQGAVGIGRRRWLASGIDIAQHNLTVFIQTFQRFFVGVIAAFAMFDRDFEQLTLFCSVGERRIGFFDAQMNLLADKLQGGVAHQRTRQQAGFAENLKAVADAEN